MRPDMALLWSSSFHWARRPSTAVHSAIRIRSPAVVASKPATAGDCEAWEPGAQAKDHCEGESDLNAEHAKEQVAADE